MQNYEQLWKRLNILEEKEEKRDQNINPRNCYFESWIADREKGGIIHESDNNEN